MVVKVDDTMVNIKPEFKHACPLLLVLLLYLGILYLGIVFVNGLIYYSPQSNKVKQY